MGDVLPFRKKDQDPPIIESDYFGNEKFPLLDLLEQLDKLKNEKSEDKRTDQ